MERKYSFRKSDFETRGRFPTYSSDSELEHGHHVDNSISFSTPHKVASAEKLKRGVSPSGRPPLKHISDHEGWDKRHERNSSWQNHVEDYDDEHSEPESIEHEPIRKGSAQKNSMTSPTTHEIQFESPYYVSYTI